MHKQLLELMLPFDSRMDSHNDNRKFYYNMDTIFEAEYLKASKSPGLRSNS